VRVLALPALTHPDAVAALCKDCETASTMSHPGFHTHARVDVIQGLTCVSWAQREGRILRDKLGGGALDAGRALAVGRAVLEVLLEAHDAGLFHLDLGPDRILIVTDAVVVGGFGLGRAVRLQAEAQDNPIFGPLAMLGPRYQAPEQIRGMAGDARSDIFAFGCLMHEMLAGIHPFQGATGADTLAAVLTAPPPSLPQGRAPKPLARIISHCLEKKPEERFQTCRDLQFALGGLDL